MQECADHKQLAALNLQSFTRKLRHAILSNANVASGWKPAAHTLQLKATLDTKLASKGNQASLAAASAQVWSQVLAANQYLACCLSVCALNSTVVTRSCILLVC